MEGSVLTRLPLISWVARDSYPALRRLLVAQQFTIALLDGTHIVDSASLIAQARRDLPLDPPVQGARGANWDALTDSLFGGVAAAEIRRFALVWSAADVLLARDAEVLVNALQCFTDAARDLYATPEQVAMNVFLVGEGPSFKQLSL